MVIQTLRYNAVHHSILTFMQEVHNYKTVTKLFVQGRTDKSVQTGGHAK